MEALTGQLLGGRYRVGVMVGEGGMGAVYEAVQEGLDRKVALKILHSHLTSDTELRGRFKREARVVAMLGHPNVVQISDFQANANEPPFLVMELLHGENLRDAIKRTPRMDVARVAYIAVQVLSALEAAHRANVVHRDIKPDNIFLERTSVQADIVKVLDFGVAKLMGEDEALKLTRQGLVVGTLSYMSPEQATGDKIDGRADLYSLAAAMYVALAGRKPFDGPTTGDIIRKIMTEPPVPLAVVRQDVDVELSHIIDRALAKRPDDRFASAAEMARALARFAKPTALDVATSVPPPALTVKTPPTEIQPQPTTRREVEEEKEEEAPKTLAMAATNGASEIVPRTTPIPTAPIPPMTQRSSYHPIEPAFAQATEVHAPIVVPPSPRRAKKKSSTWIVAASLGSFVVIAAGVTLIALYVAPTAKPASSIAAQSIASASASAIPTASATSVVAPLASLHPAMHVVSAAPAHTHTAPTSTAPPDEIFDDPFGHPHHRNKPSLEPTF